MYTTPSLLQRQRKLAVERALETAADQPWKQGVQPPSCYYAPPARSRYHRHCAGGGYPDRPLVIKGVAMPVHPAHEAPGAGPVARRRRRSSRSRSRSRSPSKSKANKLTRAPRARSPVRPETPSAIPIASVHKKRSSERKQRAVAAKERAAQVVVAPPPVPDSEVSSSSSSSSSEASSPPVSPRRRKQQKAPTQTQTKRMFGISEPIEVGTLSSSQAVFAEDSPFASGAGATVERRRPRGDDLDDDENSTPASSETDMFSKDEGDLVATYQVQHPHPFHNYGWANTGLPTGSQNTDARAFVSHNAAVPPHELADYTFSRSYRANKYDQLRKTKVLERLASARERSLSARRRESSRDELDDRNADPWRTEYRQSYTPIDAASAAEAAPPTRVHHVPHDPLLVPARKTHHRRHY